MVFSCFTCVFGTYVHVKVTILAILGYQGPPKPSKWHNHAKPHPSIVAMFLHTYTVLTQNHDFMSKMTKNHDFTWFWWFCDIWLHRFSWFSHVSKTYLVLCVFLKCQINALIKATFVNYTAKVVLSFHEKGSKMTKNDHFGMYQIHDFDIKTMVFMSKTTKIDHFDTLGVRIHGPRGPRMVPEGSLRCPWGYPLGDWGTPYPPGRCPDPLLMVLRVPGPHFDGFWPFLAILDHFHGFEGPGDPFSWFWGCTRTTTEKWSHYMSDNVPGFNCLGDSKVSFWPFWTILAILSYGTFRDSQLDHGFGGFLTGNARYPVCNYGHVLCPFQPMPFLPFVTFGHPKPWFLCKGSIKQTVLQGTLFWHI